MAEAPARQDTKPRKPWLWNVVLLDDQEHSYEYVIRMVQELFSASPEKALQIAQMVDRDKRAVLLTTHKELAELKREQVHAYGRDPQLAISKGSMSAVIEPAE
jgi:ATP-dependent Clp protease adaptor protein ClpS